MKFIYGISPRLYCIGARSGAGRWLSLDPKLGSLASPQTQNR